MGWLHSTASGWTVRRGTGTSSTSRETHGWADIPGKSLKIARSGRTGAISRQAAACQRRQPDGTPRSPASRPRRTAACGSASARIVRPTRRPAALRRPALDGRAPARAPGRRACGRRDGGTGWHLVGLPQPGCPQGRRPAATFGLPGQIRRPPLDGIQRGRRRALPRRALCPRRQQDLRWRRDPAIRCG